MKITKVTLALFVAAFFLGSCSLFKKIPKVECKSTKTFPVTFIKDSAAPVTQYIPICDTVIITSPSKKVDQSKVLIRKGDMIIPQNRWSIPAPRDCGTPPHIYGMYCRK